jgi:4-hydroxybenzoate polyprenyltransferase
VNLSSSIQAGGGVVEPVAAGQAAGAGGGAGADRNDAAPAPDPLADAASFAALAARHPSEASDLVRRGGRAPASFGRRVLVLFVLARPATSVAVLLSYVLGYSYTDQDFGWRAVVGLTLSFLISAGGDLYNACSDLEEDVRNEPGRVYLVAIAGYRTVFGAALATAVPILVGGLLFIPYFGALMVLAVIGLHQYSFPPMRWKARPVLGLLSFAQAGIFPFVMGWLSQPTWRSPPKECLAVFAAFVVFRVARASVKNLPDIHGDGLAGVQTSATAFGTIDGAIRASAILTASAFVVLAATIAAGWAPLRMALVLPWSVVLVAHLRAFRRTPDPRSANRHHLLGLQLWGAAMASITLAAAPRFDVLICVAGAVVLLGASVAFRVDPRALAADLADHQSPPAEPA